MLNRLFFGSVLLLLPLAYAFPADAPATPTPATPVPAAAAAADATIYAPTDLEKLKPLIGKTVKLEGTVAKGGESKSKTVRYLNFSDKIGESVALVFFVNKVGEKFSAERLQGLVGKKIQATGKLSEFSERLQIQIDDEKQIKEIPAS